MALVNISELLVKDRLNEILKEYDCCKCDVCRNDILAIVLNHVPPRYVNTKKGELIQRINATVMQNSVDLDVAIVRAIEIVSRNPHYNMTEN